MSTQRTSYALWEHAPLAIALAALLGPGLHFIAFDGFSQPDAASAAAMFGAPIAGIALLLAAAVFGISMRRPASRRELAWASVIALAAAAVWGSILIGDHPVFGMSSASQDARNLEPIQLVDYGPQGDGTHLLVLADRSIRIDLDRLEAYGFEPHDIRKVLQRGYCAVISPLQLKGAYEVLNSVHITLIGIHEGYPVYLEDVARIERL